MLAALFRKKKWLVAFVFLCLTWCCTFLFMMKSDIAKTFESRSIQAGNSSLDFEKQVIQLEMQVSKIKAESDIYRSMLEKLKNKVNDISGKMKDGKEPEIKDLKDAVANSDVLENLKPVIAKKTIPVLVLAFNRPTVSRCLDLLLKYRTSSDNDFPIVVSQDGDHKETSDVIDKYQTQLTHLHHTPASVTLPAKEKKFLGYYKLASHYKWAVNKIFELYPDAQSLIIVEDDLDISPDFFSYFSATLPLLDADPTLMCVSAWNDNGKSKLVDSNALKMLYRTDFFPGLGWMLKKEFWRELEPKWPVAFWDDWLRHPDQRRGRACIRPEISRSRTFGKKGVSNGQFYEQHLKFIVLNSQEVAWKGEQLTYLLKDRYDDAFVSEVYATPLVDRVSLFRNHGPAVRVEYSTAAGFKAAAKYLGIMTDLKAGVPRTGYLGIVSLMRDGIRIYVAPDRNNWNGYVETWS